MFVTLVIEMFNYFVLFLVRDLITVTRILITTFLELPFVYLKLGLVLLLFEFNSFPFFIDIIKI